MINDSHNQFSQVPVVILCGGNGVILDEMPGKRVNKGLVKIHNKPLFWWVMYHYVQHKANNFILAAGFQSEQFAVALESVGAKVQVTDPLSYDIQIAETMCCVRLVPTANDATTAARLLACKPWLEMSDQFAVTYSDTLSDVDLSAEMCFHKSQKLVATLVATKHPVRFRILGVRQGEALVRAFASRPVIEATSINGGYYIFSRELWNESYGLDNMKPLETQPLERLAASGQLAAFDHKGRWQYCDAERDLVELHKLVEHLYLNSIN